MLVLCFVSFNDYTQYSTLVNFAFVYGNFSNVSIDRVKFEFRDTSVITLMSMLSSFDLLMINLCSDCKLYTNFKLETRNKPFHDFPYR